MKRHLGVLLLAGLCMSSASAQFGKATTKQECNRRCNANFGGYQKTEYDEVLKKLRAKKAAETNPEKQKQLAEEEEAATEQYEVERERICRDICKSNPEE